jgi:methionine synthase I (cobalamin-dependent)/5,10-methylenetetrahydrofolate reductase
MLQAVTHPFLLVLEKGVLLCDGAMGTLLHERGVPPSACLEAVNLEKPELVASLHREYVEAGAEIIETNTFGGTALRLNRHGLAGRVREVNRRAAEIARNAVKEAGRSVFVAGAVGPIGVGIPSSEAADVSLKQARRIFREQVEALLEGQVDLIVLETFPTLAEIREALAAVREVSEVPAVAQLTFQRDGRTWAGEEPGDVVRALHAEGANVVGVNCVPGPQAALEIIEKMAAASGVKLSAQANAGQPRLLERGVVYPIGPQSFAEYVPRLIAAGATIVGGCCGTTPEHIKAMHAVLTRPPAEPAASSHAPGVIAEPAEGPDWEAAPEGETLRDKLAAGRFVVSVEVDPPKGLNPRRTLEGVAMLRDAGVDCINVGDSPRAQTRMSPLAFALLIQQRVGLETIVHFTTRDRNIAALQADLIGAHVWGLRNIFCLRGDPPSGGGYARAVAVWDISPVGLIRVLKGLNEGMDWVGNSVGQPTSFFIGAAANPTAASLEAEMKLLRRKLAAGADFIMTQAVYDVEALDRFLKAASGLKVPILLGVMPLHSLRHAEFLQNELVGIIVPEPVRERMRRAGENGLEEGITLARELMDAARGRVRGVYLMPSFGRYDVAAQLLRELRTST